LQWYIRIVAAILSSMSAANTVRIPST
jgi:hypothetical protein